MGTFVDTSGLIAYLDTGEPRHQAVRDALANLLERDEQLFVTSYVLNETYAVVQRRLGMGACRRVAQEVEPVLIVDWVDESLHAAGLSACLAANRRDLSLVDCVSFEAMARRGLQRVLALDPHFSERGFEALP